MGRAQPGMEDDGPVADICKMPSLISSFEEGRVKLSRNLQTETSLTDGKVGDWSQRVTRSNSRLSLDGGAREADERSGEEARDAEGNNNNNCNGGGERRRRASAVEILRRNFGVSKPPSPRLSASSRMQCGGEHENPGGDVDRDVNGHGTECGDWEKSHRETSDAGDKNEPTSGELPTSDAQGVEYLTVTGQCHQKYDGESHTDALDESYSVKEHVYCTVYCIANDNQRTGGEITDRYDETLSIDAPGSVADTGLDSGPSAEPSLYTLDDLVDPFGDMAHQLYMEQADTETTMQSCRVCLEDKTIAPLPCCRKAVCDECLKLYVSSQVGKERGR